MSKARVIELPWVNDGAPTTLGVIPIKGEQILERMRAEGSAIVSSDMNAWLCHLRGCLCAAKRTVEREGVDEAHRVWNIAYGSSYENLNFEKDSFAATLDQAIQDYVFQPLGVSTLTEAEVKLRDKAREANNAVKAFGQQRQEWLHDLHLEEVFWLLWRANPRPDFMPSDKKVPTDSDIAAAKNVISYFLDDDEYAKFMTAMRGAGAIKANLETLAKVMTPEAVRKKASPTSKS